MTPREWPDSLHWGRHRPTSKWHGTGEGQSPRAQEGSPRKAGLTSQSALLPDFGPGRKAGGSSSNPSIHHSCSHGHTHLTHSVLRTPTQPTLTLTLTHTRGASSSSPLKTHHPAAETPSCLHLPHHLLSAPAWPPPPSALVSEGATLGWWVVPPHFFLPAELVVMGPQQQDAHLRTLRQRLPDRQRQADRRTGRWKARFSHR